MNLLHFVAAAFLCQNNYQRYNFALPHLKRALKSPIKTGLNRLYEVLLQTSLFVVQISKTYLKALS